MQEILEKLRDLPSIPAVVQELVQSFADPAQDVQGLARRIATDPALAVKTLRLANSAFYGLSRQVSSVHEAVVVLGFGTVRSLVLSVAMVGAFPADAASCLDRNVYWKRRMAVASYAKALAKCAGSDGETAFTAGLLHDIGVMVLDSCCRERFCPLLRKAENEGKALLEAELAEFGFDHAQLGAEVVRRWNFPPAIEEAIRCRYREAPCSSLSGIVQAASLIVEHRETAESDAEWLLRMPASVREHLEPNWERLKSCLPEPAQLEIVNSVLLS